ncbi:MAG: hypothetical protein KatS3mg131_3042 [Candidatus Tectimicrobiota bacterium]|nr:MAG: hypothetical protein KatS3mg131_3042 [Candidatus Tectomicrobia bacterium]
MLEAIAAADLLVICPGSLFTGIVPVLLHAGVASACAESRARCVYVCNLMTQPGQTDGFTAAQHVAVLERYLGAAGPMSSSSTPAPYPPRCSIFTPATALSPVVNDLAGDAVWAADVAAWPAAEALQAYARPAGKGMHVGLHLIRHDPHKLAAQLEALLPACGGRR